MNLPEEQFFEDERDWGLQQKMDCEAREQVWIDILSRLAEGVPITRIDVETLCSACGINKKLVFGGSLDEPVRDDKTIDLPF